MTSPTSRTPGRDSGTSAASPTPGAGKPPEVEEWVDETIHRPLARPLVRLLVRTPLTPNQVTLLSAFLGVSAGVAVMVGVERPAWRLASGLLLFSCVVFDCCDGQLARARGVSSTYGAILDGISDYAVGIAMGIGGSYYMAHILGSGWWWIMGVAGIVSSAVQAALFDHTKTRYIALVAGGYREREEDLDKIAADLTLAVRERRLRDAALLWVYQRYSRAQHLASAVPPASDPAAYRARHAGRMRAWTWMGGGTHLTLAYVLTGIAFWWPPAATGYFMVAATIMNLFLAALLVWDRRAAEA